MSVRTPQNRPCEWPACDELSVEYLYVPLLAGDINEFASGQVYRLCVVHADELRAAIDEALNEEAR